MAFVVAMAHDSGYMGAGEGVYKIAKTYGEAVDIAHEFFLSYDFEVRDGKPYDPGNDPDGFTVFDDVIMHKGKVAEFTHCGGDGPVCHIKGG